MTRGCGKKGRDKMESIHIHIVVRRHVRLPRPLEERQKYLGRDLERNGRTTRVVNARFGQ